MDQHWTGVECSVENCDGWDVNCVLELLTESTGWKEILGITEKEEEEAAEGFGKAMIWASSARDDVKLTEAEVAEEPGCFHEVLHIHSFQNTDQAQSRWSRLKTIWKALGFEVMENEDDEEKGNEGKWTEKEILVFLLACLGYAWKSDVKRFVYSKGNWTSRHEEDQENELIDCAEIYSAQMVTGVLTVTERKKRNKMVKSTFP